MILSDYKYYNEPYYGFLRINYKSGLVIVFSILLSIIAVNTGISRYFYLLAELPFKLGIGNLLISYSLKEWINNFLMPVFFFLMGLGLKRELIFLRNNKTRSLTLILTVILCFLIPITFIKIFFKELKLTEILYLFSTDIVLIMLILNIFHSKINSGIKSFLLSYSILMNTILMILIINDNNKEFNLYYFLFALSLFIYLIFFNVLKIKLTLIYLFLALAIIYLFYKAGLNLSSVSLLVAFIIPVNRKIRIRNFYNLMNENLKLFTSRDEKKVFLTDEQVLAIDRMKIALDKVQGPLQYFEHILHNLVVYFIIPIFIFVNSGVYLNFNHFNSNLNVFILNFFTLLVRCFAFFLSINIINFLRLDNPFSKNILLNISISFISTLNLIIALFLVIKTNSNTLLITNSKLSILLCCFITIFFIIVFLFFADKRLKKELINKINN